MIPEVLTFFEPVIPHALLNSTQVQYGKRQREMWILMQPKVQRLRRLIEVNGLAGGNVEPRHDRQTGRTGSYTKHKKDVVRCVVGFRTKKTMIQVIEDLCAFCYKSVKNFVLGSVKN